MCYFSGGLSPHLRGLTKELSSIHNKFKKRGWSVTLIAGNLRWTLWSMFKMVFFNHLTCTSEADKSASLTPHSATCWQSVLSIRTHLWSQKQCLWNSLLEKSWAWLKLAGPYSKVCSIVKYGAAGWVILKILEFQNVPMSEAMKLMLCFEMYQIEISIQTVTRYKICILVHTRTYGVQVSSYMPICT